MRPVILLAALTVTVSAQQSSSTLPSFDRLAAEAQAFAEKAPRLIGQETLRQKSLVAQRRFRVRIGQGAVRPPDLEYRTREVVSEYSFFSASEAPGDLFELREVTKVDGKEVQTLKEARRKLYIGLKGSDKIRKRILEDFQRFGLEGAVTGLGQSILLFRKPRLDQFLFVPAGGEFIGADETAIVAFRQKEGQEGLTVFEGRSVKRFPLQGRIWLRKRDNLPVRIEFRAWRSEGDARIADVTEVEYAMSRHAVLVPVWARHRQTVNGTLAMENAFQYKNFRMFSSESDIQYDLGGEGEAEPDHSSGENAPKKP